ncbi:MAG: UDP-N-acetylmuramate--L-alanine ligase [Phycisphaerae bacterium]|nr:UDP-N-acetylmuramate--L-alanine ligase [Phycisphaerae bacterium]
MSGLAQVLAQRGCRVSGSDQQQSATLDRLAERGVEIHLGHQETNLADDLDCLVVSAAVGTGNPELIAARRRGLTIRKYAEMLGELTKQIPTFAVAGTHGKSTTTAMIAHTMVQAGQDPSFVIGATAAQLGGPSRAGSGRFFVAEACEFDRSFLNLQPMLAAVLNIEEDHLDCYRDLDAIIEAFRAFAAGIQPGGVLVCNGEDRNALEAVRDADCTVETFGMTEGCTWCGTNVTTDRGKVTMTITKDDQPFGQVTVPLPGLHNAYNSLGAIAILHHAGLGAEEILRNLETFEGVKRRMTVKHSDDEVVVVDDFAHHPTEIQATLRALVNAHKPRRVICIFQPHQHSRTRFLLKDFAQSFALADEVIVPDIYFVRDSQQEKDYVSSKDLVAQIRLRGGMAIYLKTFEMIVEYLKGIFEPGDLVVTMGAGNVWQVADEFVQWINDKQ